MFWGSFSYDIKGPCYCWEPEIVKEKEVVKEEIKRLNEELELLMKKEWEL